MELFVTRHWPDDVCIIGELTQQGLDGVLAYTLEPELAHAIPCGRYRITIERSPRFSAMNGCTCNGAGCPRDVFLPRYHDVPGFDGVLMHAGNHRSDTRGCTLLGETRAKDEILQSRDAMGKVQPKIQAAIDRGEAVWCTVQNAPAA